MRSLITGIGGFAGGHLAAELMARGHEVAGFGLDLDANRQLEPITHRIRAEQGDILDADALRRFVEEVRPDTIFHLAAITHVAQAWETRRQTLEINVIGTAGILETAAGLDPSPRVILASSGQVYGPGGGDSSSFREDDPTNPQGPYAVSKCCAELLAHQAWSSENVPTVVMRTFNYTGPWQAPSFVASDFARQVAWAEAGLGPAEMTVGNLESCRDFSDVRDVVDGYIRAATDGEPGSIYNLASGRAVPIQQILDYFTAAATVQIAVRQDAERFRQADLTVLRGDASRARDELGWTPAYSLDETLQTVLDFWRTQAGQVADAG